MEYNSSSSVRELFNTTSMRYDQLNDLLSLGLHRIWKRQLLSIVAPVKGENWVDLCCGTGDMTLALAKKVLPAGRVLGVDNAELQLNIAMKRANKEPWLPVSWLEKDVLSTGLPSSSFDGGVMAYGLRNLKDPLQGLLELKRLLKEGAKAGILDFNRQRFRSFGDLFQKFYLRNIVVKIAGIYGLSSEYKYIENSISCFPDGKQMEEMALIAGFSRASYISIAAGQMGILSLRS